MTDMENEVEIKEFLTEAFLRYGRNVPYEVDVGPVRAKYYRLGVSIMDMERLGLLQWHNAGEDWFHITDKGIALIGEDND